MELEGDLLPKRDYEWSLQWHCLPFLSLYVNANGQTSILRDFVKILLHPIATTWSNSPSGNWRSSSIWRRVGRMHEEKSSMVLRNGYSTIGYPFWQKEEEPRKGFNIVWTLTLPSTSCISEQSRDIQEVISLILHCKTMYCCQRTSPSTSITSEM